LIGYKNGFSEKIIIEQYRVANRFNECGKIATLGVSSISKGFCEVSGLYNFNLFN